MLIERQKCRSGQVYGKWKVRQGGNIWINWSAGADENKSLVTISLQAGLSFVRFVVKVLTTVLYFKQPIYPINRYSSAVILTNSWEDFMKRILWVLSLFSFLLTFSRPEQGRPPTAGLSRDPAAQPQGRLVVFEGFLRST